MNNIWFFPIHFQWLKLNLTVWMTTVIGLLITSLTFAILTNGLSLLGLCSSNLTKKLYYFNSSSEINLICGIELLYNMEH